jgi:hypothetical protein
MTLIDRMLKLAGLWAAASGHSTTSRLSTIVAPDGGLLRRLEQGGGCTVDTLDKFAHFLRDPANWPESAVPSEACELLGAIGHIKSLPGERDALADLDRRQAAARGIGEADEKEAA